MINIAICDDDKIIVAEIERLLLEISEQSGLEMNIEGYYEGSSLEKDINKGEYFDLIYLDIKMRQNGVTTARHLRLLGQKSIIIYVSSYDQYCKDLFEVDTFRFLKKPIHKEKFRKYFGEAIEIINSSNNYYAYQFNRSWYKVKIKDICYFESRKRKIIIHKNDGSLLEYYGKLNEIEQYFKEIGVPFIRGHQSFLINYSYIIGCKMKCLELSNGEVLPVSEERQKYVNIQYSRLLRKELFNFQAQG